ncbi:MAG: hypothetical protein J6W12_02755 [Bacteroidales bacterium]|nr:hypothetical protein [Bacteroidales bacterium]MBQ4205783.1 hypothetical protein [Bacteroidales bacterium]
MKRLAYFLITALLLTALPEIVSAQSNDPFEQQVIQSKGGKNEKRNKNRRKVTTEEVTPAPTPAPQPQQEEKKPVNEMVISNPCSEWLDFELVSVVGSRGSQTVKMTMKLTQHQTNKRMSVGGNFIAYDCEGVEHSRGYSVSTYDMITDVTVRTEMDIPGKINPNNTKVMPVIIFNVGDCRIEMRNVPIDWK